MGFPSLPETKLGRAWREMQHFTFHLCGVPGCHPQHLSAAQSEACVRPAADVPRASCHSESRQDSGGKGGCSGGASKKPYTSFSCRLPLPTPTSSSLSALFVLISFRAQPPGRQVKVYPPTTHHFPRTPPGGGTLDAWGKGKPKQLTQHCRHHHL